MRYQVEQDDQDALGLYVSLIQDLKNDMYPIKKREDRYVKHLCVKEEDWQEISKQSNEDNKFYPVMGSTLRYQAYCDSAFAPFMTLFGFNFLSFLYFC